MVGTGGWDPVPEREAGGEGDTAGGGQAQVARAPPPRAGRCRGPSEASLAGPYLSSLHQSLNA